MFSSEAGMVGHACTYCPGVSEEYEDSLSPTATVVHFVTDGVMKCTSPNKYKVSSGMCVVVSRLGGRKKELKKLLWTGEMG